MLVFERQRETVDDAAENFQQLRNAVVLAGQLIDKPDPLCEQRSCCQERGRVTTQHQ